MRKCIKEEALATIYSKTSSVERLLVTSSSEQGLGGRETGSQPSLLCGPMPGQTKHPMTTHAPKHGRVSRTEDNLKLLAATIAKQDFLCSLGLT